MKVRLRNMRSHGCRDLLVYCGNAPRCWHSATINANHWPVGLRSVTVRLLDALDDGDRLEQTLDQPRDVLVHADATFGRLMHSGVAGVKVDA